MPVMPRPNFGPLHMDISRAEQRILHLLAQGGHIDLIRDEHRKPTDPKCFTRDGWRYGGLDLILFRKLKRKRAIASRGGGPYRITRRGLDLVRAEPDNR
tara:strand:+ start:735 stop:1031 length:297 start_codon:yes stop_codon:yes gene_type:complete